MLGSGCAVPLPVKSMGSWEHTHARKYVITHRPSVATHYMTNSGQCDDVTGVLLGPETQVVSRFSGCWFVGSVLTAVRKQFGKHPCDLCN